MFFVENWTFGLLKYGNSGNRFSLLLEVFVVCCFVTFLIKFCSLSSLSVWTLKALFHWLSGKLVITQRFY